MDRLESFMPRKLIARTRMFDSTMPWILLESTATTFFQYSFGADSTHVSNTIPQTVIDYVFYIPTSNILIQRTLLLSRGGRYRTEFVVVRDARLLYVLLGFVCTDGAVPFTRELFCLILLKSMCAVTACFLSLHRHGYQRATMLYAIQNATMVTSQQR